MFMVLFLYSFLYLHLSPVRSVVVHGGTNNQRPPISDYESKARPSTVSFLVKMSPAKSSRKQAVCAEIQLASLTAHKLALCHVESVPFLIDSTTDPSTLFVYYDDASLLDEASPFDLPSFFCFPPKSCKTRVLSAPSLTSRRPSVHKLPIHTLYPAN